LALDERERFLVWQAREPRVAASGAGKANDLAHVGIVSKSMGRTLSFSDPDELFSIDNGKAHQLPTLNCKAIQNWLGEIRNSAPSEISERQRRNLGRQLIRALDSLLQNISMV
jgi:hypothetical protein